MSERRACRVLGQSRSTHRYQRRIRDDEPRLVARILDADDAATILDHNFHVTTFVVTSNGVTGALLGDVNLDRRVDVLTEVVSVKLRTLYCSVAEPARKIKENAQLSGELRRSRPLRVSMSEGMLHLHAGRIPTDPVGFKLLCELLTDLAEFLNGSGTGRG